VQLGQRTHRQTENAEHGDYTDNNDTCYLAFNGLETIHDASPFESMKEYPPQCGRTNPYIKQIKCHRH
jgi:hypothetical protein